MERFDKLGRLLAGLVVAAVVMAAVGGARADQGWDAAMRIERGQYPAMRKVTGSSVAGTAFFDADMKRPDGLCVNNTGTTVWIGTVSATQRGDSTFLHDNINFGAPLTATATFSLDGSFTGLWYFTCGPTVATCEMRCLDGKVN